MTDQISEHYRAIVIGSGQAGGPLASALAGAAWKTALVESTHMGGTCVNEGCTPTKTMVASARVAYLARRGADYGVQTGPITVDMAKVRERKRAIVDSFRGGSEKSVEAVPNLDVFLGHGRFTDAHTVEVAMNDGGTRRLHADTIFLNTGARPSKLPIPGLNSLPTLDSTSIMELDTLPGHLLVIGGSYIGLEFGQMFRRFGSAVTIIEHGSKLVAREDDDIAEEILKIMREDGITVHLNATIERAAQSADGSLELHITTPDGTHTLSGSHILSAAGRTPNSDQLNLDAAGVKTDKHGYIEANERLETSAPHIYVLGDVKGGPAFTHISYDDYRILRDNLLHGGKRTTNDRPVPYTVFIDPQLGRVGLSESEARAQGRNFKVVKLPMTRVARAREVDETRGFMKALIDPDNQQILGCAILGLEGGEIMSVLETAMLGKLPYTVLKEGVYAHPTLSESLNNLFMTLDQ